MSAARVSHQARVSHETYLQVFGAVYVGLMTNVLLLVSCFPLVLLLVVTDPAVSWPLLALVAPITAPAAVAAFAVFAGFSAEGSTAAVRTFLRTWRATARRAGAVGAMTTLTVVVLLVDVRALSGSRAGALAIPVFLVLAVLAVATAVLTLTALADRPTARLRHLARAALYLAVRRWHLTAVSLGVLLLQGAVLAVRPALALGLTATPLLYVVWANSRYALRPVLDPADDGREPTVSPAFEKAMTHP